MFLKVGSRSFKSGARDINGTECDCSLRLTRRPEGPCGTPLPGTLPCARKYSEIGPHGAGLLSQVLGRLKRESAKYQACLSFSEFKASSHHMELSKTLCQNKN